MGFSLGGFVSDIFGSKNKVHADAPKVDPNAYQYGGNPNGANEAAGRYQATGENAQGRQGAQAGYRGADMAYQQGQQARAGQASLASRMDARAAGQVPSIAGMQAQQDAQRAQAAQMSAAASARGPAGIALAQQQAANNTANAQAQISGQAQVNAANERLAAEQAASNAYGNLCGGDQATQGQLAQQSQFNAQLQQNQHALNDQMQLGMTQAEMGVRNSQLTAQMNQQAQQSGNQLGATGINAGVGGQNAAMNQQNGVGVVKLIQGSTGVAATAAKGGPIRRGAPTIVGEEGPEYVSNDDRRGFIVGQHGPELIVPRQDSVVIPNHVAFPPGTPTWGTGTTPAQAPAPLDERYHYAERDARLPMTGGMAVPGFSPGIHTSADQPLRQRDQDTLSSSRAKQAEGIELTDAEEQAAKGAAYRERQSRRNEGEAAVEPTKAKATGAAAQNARPTLASRMQAAADGFTSVAGNVDVSYHGPTGGYAPMQLIPIGGRAMGGPVDSGVPYMVGEQGPEQLVPMSGPGAPGAAPAVPSFGSQMSSDPWGGVMSAKSASIAKNPDIASVNASVQNPGGRINAFEGGGEAEGGKPALVGERGAEAVLPLYEPPGKQLHQSASGHAYLANEPTEEDNRPSLTSRMKAPTVPASAASAAPQPPKAKAKAERKMTPEEMLAEADRIMSQQREQHDARMAQGPAVRMPVQLTQAADGTQVAQVEPAYAPSPHALPPPPPQALEGVDMPPSPTALPGPAPRQFLVYPGGGLPPSPTALPLPDNIRPSTYSTGRRGGGLARAMRKR